MQLTIKKRGLKMKQELIKSGPFIPKNLYIKSDKNSPFNGRTKQVKYCYFSIYSNKIKPVCIEQYYDKNFARTEMITLEDFDNIDKNEISINNIELYKNAF